MGYEEILVKGEDGMINRYPLGGMGGRGKRRW